MSVIEVRGHKQSSVSKLISKLARYVIQGNSDEVKTTISKLNTAFDEYEAAHDDVLATLEEDQSRCDAEDTKFIEVEMKYVESLKAANEFLKDDTPSVSADIAHLLNIPKVEIKSFSGTPTEYLSFVAVFDETVGKVSIDGQAKLTRLLQYTTSQARAAIDCCALIGGTEGYDEARRILKERFGNPYMITTALLDKLRERKDARSPALLRALADELNSAKIVLKSMKMYSELDNQHHIKEIGSRLSPHLWNKWCDRVFHIKREHKRYASFDEFVAFVIEKADEANDPIYGQVPATVHTSSAARATGYSPVLPFKPAKPCIMCNYGHPLFRCDEFKNLDVLKRTEFVNKQLLCHNCLRSGHTAAVCGMPTFCRDPTCDIKHNRLLHQAVAVNHRVDNSNVSNVCMPIARVIANNVCPVYCLLDTGSTTSFISSSLVSKLSLPTTPISLSLETLSKAVNKKSSLVDVAIESADHDFCINMKNIFVVDSIPTRAYNIDVNMYPHLINLNLVNPFHEKVDLLIGQDYASCFFPQGVYRGKKNEPYAVKTPLGCVLHGANSTDSHRISAITHLISAATLEQDINKLWEIDQCDVTSSHGYSVEDRQVLSLWDEKSRLVDDHWMIPIPWKDTSVILHNNYNQAKSRLMNLEKSLKKKSAFEEYNSSVQKLLEDGYAEHVQSQGEDGRLWYLPHHGVPKKDGSTRLVFDCACKYRGASLNDVVYQGPDLIEKLNFVLLRFRRHQYALTADIKSMYNQVRVPKEHRDALRFLWFEDNRVIELRMTSHLFGGIWCSSCVCYALKRSVQHIDCDKDVEFVVSKSFYVDDLLHSMEDKEYATDLMNSTKDLLSSNGFHLSKFAANDRAMLQAISGDVQQSVVNEAVTISDGKVLGVIWDNDQDTFYFKVKICDGSVVTRRSILSFVSSIFDPLGLISPILVVGKTIFQHTTKLKMQWDTPVPTDIRTKWFRWLDELRQLHAIKIPRCIKPIDFNDSYLELHCFNDASEYSYGCCLYLRCVNKVGVHTSLIYAKHRLCPIQSTTVPRLELQSAVLSARVSHTIMNELELPIIRTYRWTDSMIVLGYIRSECRRFKTYVENRVNVIRQLTNTEEWYHIEGKDNPADIVSRGSTPEQLDQEMWLKGPSFLKDYKSQWELTSKPDTSLDPRDPELKNADFVHACIVTESVHPIELLCSHYSSWYKLKKAVAWLMKLQRLLLKRPVKQKHLSVDDIKGAEIAIIQHVQMISFCSEVESLTKNKPVLRKSRLYKLNPALMDDVIVVKGRLALSNLPEQMKMPYIIPHDHSIAYLIVRDIHNGCHLGQEWVISLVRRKYWITHMRKIVKKISRECVICKRRFAQPGFQQMANLPTVRLEPHHPAFHSTGLDCFGPYMVKYGRGTIKRYGCVYTCLTTRAVHVEKLNSLDTDSFISALRRFISRRGSPSTIYCDNGTNIVGAHNELKRSLKEIQQIDVRSFCLKNEIQWVFNPPHSSHMGGIYERMIRTIRKVFLGVLNPNVRLTDEILETVFCEVEGIINGRPLTKLSPDADDIATLSPNNLLILRNELKVAPGCFTLGEMYRKRWRHTQHLVDAFWRKWLTCYLPDLQKRDKWQEMKTNIGVGDLVLILGETAPRGLWPLGLVKEVFTSDDGLVRSVKVNTTSSEFIRPITKIVLLEGCEQY